MSGEILVYSDHKYSRFDNVREASKIKCSMMVIDDIKMAENVNILKESISGYIFLVLNGSENILLEKLKEEKITDRPKRLFVISKETKNEFLDELPKLLPCEENWTERVGQLFSKLKKETRDFFSNSIFI